MSMSSGRPSTTGPGRPAQARWNARLTSSGMRAASSISAAHFALWPNIARMSISCSASRSRVPRSICPTNRISGVESWNAVCTPTIACDAPGPRVTKHTPGRPVSLPCASAIWQAVASCRQVTSFSRPLTSCMASSAARKLSPGTWKAMSAPWISSWSTRILPPCRRLLAGEVLWAAVMASMSLGAVWFAGTLSRPARATPACGRRIGCSVDSAVRQAASRSRSMWRRAPPWCSGPPPSASASGAPKPEGRLLLGHGREPDTSRRDCHYGRNHSIPACRHHSPRMKS